MVENKYLVELPEPGELSNKTAISNVNKYKAKHSEILSRLLRQLIKVDFVALAQLKKGKEKLSKKHYLVCCVDYLIKRATDNNWGISVKDGFVYLYNSEFWEAISKSDMESFLGAAAEKIGIDKFDARHYVFREQLLRQFMSSANFAKIENHQEAVLINLLNGTFVITPERQHLREFNRIDFLKYQLPFNYDPTAEAPLFMNYLNKIQPDLERQNILAEYIGYLFVKNTTLKLEKTLLLYGTGANGKSVFFEIMSALLGHENISNYSLQNLTNENGYYRAKLGNKLVNYASEINGKLEASFFKQLVSGEPVEARAPYGEPFSLTNYAKLIFNCNDLPKDVEQTQAFFRRFLIVPFDITIPEEEQDKELSKRITSKELSGVFNWVLTGLQRLLAQKKFTYSEIVAKQIEMYKTQSDTVKLYMEDANLIPSNELDNLLSNIYGDYKSYCGNFGYRPCALRTFADRLRKDGFTIIRKNVGNVIYYAQKKSC